MEEKTKICVIGLGYVGLPLAIEFAKKGLTVFGFDISEKRIEELKKNIDSTNEVETSALEQAKIEYSANPVVISKADFLIVAVPTPIDKSKKPDLSLLKDASRIIGENIQKGSIVVFESTVYPGVTEEICAPLIEKYSGLQCGKDWKIGYSPERMNPGDKEHSIDKIVKITSGMDEETLEKIAEVYSLICKAGIHKTSSIKTAEAAKVIENIQRDLNIALINELALIFHRLGITTKEVLEAAETKWNFHKYEPGLPSGHCIPVDPYYLTYRAEELGYHPQVILAGRRINDYMPEYVVDLMIKGLIEADKKLQNSKVLLLGLTFKENVKDTRNSRAKDIIRKLKEYRVEPYGYDPLLEKGVIREEFGLQGIEDLNKMPKMDGIILCILQEEFKKLTLERIKEVMQDNPVLVDIKSYFLKQNPKDHGFVYKCL